MKVIRNSLLPFGKNYGAINLFGILLAKRDMRITPEVINHELIHTAQMRELLFIPFYIIYILEWLYRVIQCKGDTFQAYMNISFEKEAYRHGNNLQYFSVRRPYEQWRKG